MLEKCIADVGGTYLFCDTDSAAIVSAERRVQIPMPDGAQAITAMSWAKVQSIVDRFASLNPYSSKLVKDKSILKVHKVNWDEHKQRRQLFGVQHRCEEICAFTRKPQLTFRSSNRRHTAWAISIRRRTRPKDGITKFRYGYSRPGTRTHARRARIKAHSTRMVRTPGDDEIDAKHSASCPEKPCQGAAHAPEHFMMLPQVCRFGCSSKR